MAAKKNSKRKGRFGIRGRLLLGFVFIVAMSAATQLFILQGMLEAYSRWFALGEELYEKQRFAYELRNAFTQELSSLSAFFTFAAPVRENEIYEWQQRTDELLQDSSDFPVSGELNKIMTDTEKRFETSALNELTRLHFDLKALIRDEIPLGYEAKWLELRKNVLDENAPIVSAFFHKLDRYTDQSDELFDRARSKIEQDKYLVFVNLGSLIAISLLLAVILGFVVTRSIATPLRRMAETTAELASGNFRLITGALPKNEVGDLARSYNKMAVALEEREAFILQKNRELTTLNHLSTLLSTATDLSDHAEEIIAMVLEAMPINAVGYYARDSVTGNLTLKASRNLPEEFLSGAGRTFVDDHCLGVEIEPVTSLVFHSLDDVAAEEAGPLKAVGLSSVVAVPVANPIEVEALLLVCSRGIKTWPRDQLSLLGTVGRHLSLVAANLDLTRERVRSARFAAMGEAISHIGHTVKNLVGALQASTMLLERAVEKRDHEKFPKLLTVLSDVTERISVFMHDLLDFSRNQQISLESGRLDEIVREVVQIHQHQAIENGILLKAAAELDEPETSLDRNALLAALSNLVVNAMDSINETISTATENKGNILIEAFENEDCFVINVKDTGMGIPPEKLQSIWEVFFSTKGSKGTGLGLALVARVIDQHGGQISVESSEGKGTTFSITLPRMKPPD